MRYIDQRGGRFVSVLPRTRSETRDFLTLVQSDKADFREVRRDSNPRDRRQPIVYDGYESATRTSEGFRVLWYRSSRKLGDDQERRSHGMAVVRMKISQLEGRLGRGKLRQPAEARAAAEKILHEHDVARFLSVRVEERSADEYAQIGPGW